MDRVAISEALKRTRLRRGWTVEELARRMDVSKSEVSRLENNKRPQLAVERIDAWAEALGVDVELVVYDQGVDFVRRSTRNVNLTPDQAGTLRRLAALFPDLTPDRLATLNALFDAWARSGGLSERR